MNDFIIKICFALFGYLVYIKLCTKYKYFPHIETAIALQLGNFTAATLKLTESILMNVLILSGIKFTVLATLYGIIWIGRFYE